MRLRYYSVNGTFIRIDFGRSKVYNPKTKPKSGPPAPWRVCGGLFLFRRCVLYEKAKMSKLRVDTCPGGTPRTLWTVRGARPALLGFIYGYFDGTVETRWLCRNVDELYGRTMRRLVARRAVGFGRMLLQISLHGRPTRRQVHFLHCGEEQVSIRRFRGDPSETI